MPGPQERLGNNMQDALSHLVIGNAQSFGMGRRDALAAVFDTLIEYKITESGFDQRRKPFGVSLSDLKPYNRQAIAALVDKKLKVGPNGVKEVFTTPADHFIEFFISVNEDTPHAVRINLRQDDGMLAQVSFMGPDVAVVKDEGSVSFVKREQIGDESTYIALTLIPNDYSYVGGTEEEILDIVANHAEQQRSIAKGIVIINQMDTRTSYP